MSETEKITINMNAADLGKIHLRMMEGLDSNRTDFTRPAIRSRIDRHAFEVQETVARNSYGIGVFAYNRSELEHLKWKNEKVKRILVGPLRLADDIPPELADRGTETVQARGMFQASLAVRAVLANRMN